MAEIGLSPKRIVDSGLCIGCGSCAAQADRTMRWDAYGQRKPAGADLAQPSDGFARTCPFSPAALDENILSAEQYGDAAHADPWIGRFHAAYVGHAEGDFRPGGSSGGMVSWVAAELLRTGRVDGVIHVAPHPRAGGAGEFFGYGISRTEDAIREGAKSRYYPVDMAGVIAEVRAVPGRYAVVGIPCFIKAVQLLRREDPVMAERIAYTLGLFCGHMKSARFVDSFAWQLNTPMREVARVDYRLKDPNRPANWYTAHLTLEDGSTRSRDWWHLADGDWGAGFFMNSACNFCDDVVAETADIAFGDAWVEPYSSDGRGTNVVIVRSAELHAVVADAIGREALSLEAVDADFIRNTQAAGFRQRREGLAYRLSLRRSGLMPRKRVSPGDHDLPLRRKLIYRARAAISRWSHRMAWLAYRTGWSAIYVRWARAALKVYGALAYRRGRLGKLLERLDGAEH